MRRRILIAVMSALLAGEARAQLGGPLKLQVREAPTVENGRKLFIVAPSNYFAIAGGLAVDKYGNIYVSDWGDGSTNAGSIVMIPKDRDHVLRIILGLTRPMDIELSPDQRALWVSEADGSVTKYYFGLCIRVVNLDPLGGSTRIYVQTTFGPRVAAAFVDGYYGLPNVLLPGQADTVDVTIEHEGKTRTIYGVFLGQPGEARPYGQTIKDVAFSWY